MHFQAFKRGGYHRFRWWEIGPLLVIHEKRPWRTEGWQLWLAGYGLLLWPLRRLS